MAMAVVPAPLGLAGLGSTAGVGMVFLVGGMAMLAFIVVLVLLQNIFTRPPPAEGRPRMPDGHSLRPMAAPPGQALPAPGRGMGNPRSRPAIDRSLERVIRRGFGEPRLLAQGRGWSHVRMYGCPTCRTAGSRDQGGCDAEGAALREAFGVVHRKQARVRETACARSGAEHCEFEVVL